MSTDRPRLPRSPAPPAAHSVARIHGLGRVAYEAQENFVVDVISDFAGGGLDEIDFGHSGLGGGDGGAFGGDGDGGSAN